jgi:hypothetical protein
MAAGWPTKVTYANGDVYTADDVNSTNGTLNYINPSSATDGQILTRNSAASGQVSWSSLFAAGVNKIINGDFNIWQRGTSFTATGYSADRYYFNVAGGAASATCTKTAFTAGTAPAAGYESGFYASTATTAGVDPNSAIYLANVIEDVRTFAGQQVTISFWAKASSGTPKIAIETEQKFGAGGSPSSNVQTYVTQKTLSTSWARYSATFTVPSLSGKTIGTTSNTSSLWVYLWLSAGSNNNARTGSLGLQSNTFDIWGVQFQAGAVATPFQTASGSLGGELSLCQRYFTKSFLVNTTPANNYAVDSGAGRLPRYVGVVRSDGTWISGGIFTATTMRSEPSVTLYYPTGGSSGQGYGFIGNTADANIAITGIDGSQASDRSFGIYITGKTGGNAGEVGVQWIAAAEL